jgi:hypothetical protein
MTTYTWAVGADGNWTTATNWLPNGQPRGADTAYIDSTGVAYTVSEDFTGTIGNLVVSDPTSDADPTLNFIGSAALTVTGLVTNEGNIIVSTGQSLSFGSMLNDDSLLVSGGSLSGPIDDDGFIQGSGTIAGALSGTGVVDAQGGTLELTSTVTSSDIGFEVEQGGVLKVDQSVLSTAGFTFNGTQGTLDIGTTFDGRISGMKVGASAVTPTTVIDVAQTITSGTLSGKSLNLYDGAALVETISLANSYSRSTHVITTPDTLGGTDVFFSTAAAAVPCYAAGTRILTADGERNVEDLAEGDMVMVRTGDHQAPRAVKWLGRRRIDLTAHAHPNQAAPIRILRDAVGPNLPHRDLLVSPDHCLLIEGWLIPALLLVNDMTIAREQGLASVEYFHVELFGHGILLAEGLPAESYLDTGNRSFFANAGRALLLHPEFQVNAAMRTRHADACAPIAVDPVTLRPIWQRLFDRAVRQGFVADAPLTGCDPDLRAVVAGVTIQAAEATQWRYVFVLPAGTGRVVLTSRATAPAAITRYLDDRRNLGVAVGGISLRTGDDVTIFPADHLPAGAGWHAAEQVDGRSWRWTNGAGELLFAPLREATMLEVSLAGGASYIIQDDPARLAA